MWFTFTEGNYRQVDPREIEYIIGLPISRQSVPDDN
jgi:hypothetical protein